MKRKTRRLYCVEWTQYSIRPKRSAICNRCFLGPTRIVDANDISIATAGFAGLTRWQTDWQTDGDLPLTLLLLLLLLLFYYYRHLFQKKFCKCKKVCRQWESNPLPSGWYIVRYAIDHRGNWSIYESARNLYRGHRAVLLHTFTNRHTCSSRKLSMALSTAFTQCFLETTKFGKITQNKGHFAVLGHSRSPILVPVESSYTTSYQWLILTYLLYRTKISFEMSKIAFFATDLAFKLPDGEFLLVWSP